MLTLCWAAKGGSGTSLVAATLALTAAGGPTTLVDLDGDQLALLGLGDDGRPGVLDWLASSAGTDRLHHLIRPVTDTAAVLPAGRRGSIDASRWSELAHHLEGCAGDVVIDAGTGDPPSALRAVADRAWLVTRACYLAVCDAVAQAARPTGIVLVEEPGRSLRPADLEHALGAPVVRRLLVDPAVARAADAGLLTARLPSAYRRHLGEVA